MPTRPRYYDLDGHPISNEEWFKLLEQPDVKRIASTVLPDGKWVSTVWLGLDHSFVEEGPPVLWETMVFPSEREYGDLDCERYTSREAAVEGHARMVAKWGQPGATRDG